MIKYPLRVEQSEGSKYAHIKDSSDRIVTGTMLREDAEEWVKVLNPLNDPDRPTVRDGVVFILAFVVFMILLVKLG